MTPGATRSAIDPRIEPASGELGKARAAGPVEVGNATGAGSSEEGNATGAASSVLGNATGAATALSVGAFADSGASSAASEAGKATGAAVSSVAPSASLSASLSCATSSVPSSCTGSSETSVGASCWPFSRSKPVTTADLRWAEASSVVETWSAHISANTPPRAISSACVPCSIMRPSLRTTILDVLLADTITTATAMNTYRSAVAMV